jgi:hypothetical protein
LKAHLTGRLSLSFIYLNSLPPNERFQWLERLQRKNERRDFCACQVGPSKAARAGGVESAAWQLSNFAKKTSLALFLNLAIGSSATSEKAKHGSARLARKCRFVRKQRGTPVVKTSCAKRDAEYPALPAD